jgi:hypothetical protein
MLPDVLEIPGLSAVNVVVDPGGPPLSDLLPRLRSVQESGKALHLHGDLSDADISLVRGTLSSDGLCLALVRGP